MSQETAPAVLSRPERDREEPRNIVWSVKKKHAETFFATLFTLWTILAIATSVQYFADTPKPTNIETAEWLARSALIISSKMGGTTVLVVLAALLLTPSLTVVGGIIVLSYEAFKLRFVTSQRQKLLAEGRAQSDQASREWWQRKQTAEAAGQPFEEPPPFRY